MKIWNRLLSVVLAFIMCLMPMSAVYADEVELTAKWPFNDVAEQPGDWIYDSAKYVYENGLMSGLNASTFGAGEMLSRAQFAVILNRMSGSPEVAYTAKFPDVPNGTWYSIPVLWANSVGIVTGYAHNGCFGPADPITREQMVLMMYRYANYCGYNTSSKVLLKGYSDYGKVSDYAIDAMSWAVGTGIITGDQGKLNPQGNVSRAVCATIIKRFRQKYVEGVELPVVEVPTVIVDDTYESLLSAYVSFLSGEKPYTDTILKNMNGFPLWNLSIVVAGNNGYFQSSKGQRGNYFSGGNTNTGTIYYALKDINGDGKAECVFKNDASDYNRYGYIHELWATNVSGEIVPVAHS